MVQQVTYFDTAEFWNLSVPLPLQYIYNNPGFQLKELVKPGYESMQSLVKNADCNIFESANQLDFYKKIKHVM